MSGARSAAKLGAKLGREVRFGAIDVSLGHAVIRDLEIRGPHDGDTPLVHVDRIDVEFDTLALARRHGAARRGHGRRRDRHGAPRRVTAATTCATSSSALRGDRASQARAAASGSLRPTSITVDPDHSCSPTTR